MTTLLIVGGIALILVAILAGIYNGLVTSKNRFKNAFSQIDVQLKRRYDLIPNLVETAKGYMKHEKETLQAVIEARNGAVSAAAKASGDPGNAEAMMGLAGAENALSGVLGKFFALSESYPDLKANENMLQVQEELTSTENRIAFARQAFNDAVTTYNIDCEKFPNNFIAGAFNFKTAALLESIESPEEKKVPKVSF